MRWIWYGSERASAAFAGPPASPPGRKDDTNKPRWTLLPWRTLTLVAAIADAPPNADEAEAIDRIAAVLCGATSADRLPAAILALLWRMQAPGGVPAMIGHGWTAMPWLALAHVVAVLEHDAQHYGADNWLRVENLRDRYLNAALRHIVAAIGGEWVDPDSGRPHLAHAVASLGFVLEDAEMGREEGKHHGL